jgi:hypothetical protein
VERIIIAALVLIIVLALVGVRIVAETY